MEKHKPTGHVLTPESHRKAPPYHAPTLTTYGSVAKLTQGGSGSAVDGVNETMMVPSGLGGDMRVIM